MSGFCFARIEVFARKSRSDSRMNRTVDEVLDEAERIEGNMPHVKNPHAPKVVDGCSFEELRQSHNAVENAKQTQKNGRERKVRTTQNTLATAVLSYPVSVEALKKASPEEKQKYLHWRRDAIQFMRDEWGEDYKCAVQHTDEKFPHLHLYAVRTDFDAKQNHPGYRAQKEALANGKSGKEAEIAGAIALKAFLNSYYEQVGQKYGMARYGPRRTRSSRCKWVKEQIANDAHAQILRDRDKYKQSIKEEVAREWAETSTIGKLSFARSTASDADIKKRSNTLFREAIEQYSGQYRNAEKAIEKAVSERNDAQKKAISAERQNSHLVSRNAELESKIITADDALSRIDAALAENVMNLHEEASESGLETDYQKLSGACLAVVDISKVQKLELALLQVSSVVKDVSRRVPEMFKKTFSWAIEKVYRHHSMASPGPEGP